MRLRKHKKKLTGSLNKTNQSDKENLTPHKFLKELSDPTSQQIIKVLELENIGYWAKFPESNMIWFSDIAARIIGIKNFSTTLSVNDLLNNIYQEDRSGLRSRGSPGLCPRMGCHSTEQSELRT